MSEKDILREVISKRKCPPIFRTSDMQIGYYNALMHIEDFIRCEFCKDCEHLDGEDCQTDYSCLDE